MVTQFPPYVNDPVDAPHEAQLTSYAVTVSAHGRTDVCLRVAGYDRAVIVHQPADLAAVRDLIDLTPCSKPRKASERLIVSFRDDGKRLQFVGLRRAFISIEVTSC